MKNKNLTLNSINQLRFIYIFYFTDGKLFCLPCIVFYLIINTNPTHIRLTLNTIEVWFHFVQTLTMILPSSKHSSLVFCLFSIQKHTKQAKHWHMCTTIIDDKRMCLDNFVVDVDDVDTVRNRVVNAKKMLVFGFG